MKKMVTVDGVEYAYYTKPGHDFFSKNIIAMRKNMPEFIRSIMANNESFIPLPYPYRRLSAIEVPASFFGYDRPWCFYQDAVQPEQILVHERGMLLGNINFDDFLHFRIKTSPVETRAEIEKEYLTRLFCWDILNERQSRYTERLYTQNLSINSPGLIQSYQPFPNWYDFLYGDGLPKESLLRTILGQYVRTNGAFQANEDQRPDVAACLALDGVNMMTILSDPSFENVAYHVMNLKAKFFCSSLRMRCGEKEFDAFLYEYLMSHRWGTLDAAGFFDSVKRTFGFDMLKMFTDFCQEKRLPAFEVSNIRYNELVTENGACGQIFVTVKNSGAVDGILEIRSNRNGSYIRYVSLSGGEAKEIGVIVDQLPSIITLNTMISRNIPNRIEIDTRKLPQDPRIQKADLYDGERHAISLNNDRDVQILVDNEDPGFTILSQPKEMFIRKVFPQKKNEPEPYLMMNYDPVPGRWMKKYNNSYYGRIYKSAYVIKSGGGDAVVAWSAKIPEPGEYELLFHTVDYSAYPIPVTSDFHFSIDNENDAENRTINLSRFTGEWVSLGEFYFKQGNSHVRLSNKSMGELVYADAVKLVKK